jgi:hypothetical protein
MTGNFTGPIRLTEAALGSAPAVATGTIPRPFVQQRHVSGAAGQVAGI